MSQSSHEGKTSPPCQEIPGHPGQPKMYYVNVSGEKILVVDPDQVPAHEQIVMDTESVMYVDPTNKNRVWVPPNTPHLDSTDFYYSEEAELYNIQGNDRVMAALHTHTAPPNTPHHDRLANPSEPASSETDPDALDMQYVPADYVLEDDMPPEMVAMVTGEQEWRAEDSMVAGRGGYSRMGNGLQVTNSFDPINYINCNSN